MNVLKIFTAGYVDIQSLTANEPVTFLTGTIELSSFTFQQIAIGAFSCFSFVTKIEKKIRGNARISSSWFNM
jgi:hypothetical protein